MIHRKAAITTKEEELLEDVHKTEEEIDLFLETTKKEVELILKDATIQAENFRVQTAREAVQEGERLRELYIANAEKEAEAILDEGLRTIERDSAYLEEIRTTVTGKIMDYLLGRDR